MRGEEPGTMSRQHEAHPGTNPALSSRCDPRSANEMGAYSSSSPIASTSPSSRPVVPSSPTVPSNLLKGVSPWWFGGCAIPPNQRISGATT